MTAKAKALWEIEVVDERPKEKLRRSIDNKIPRYDSEEFR